MKKFLIILGVIVVIGIGLFTFYNINLGSVSNKDEPVTFNVAVGASNKEVVKNLKEANLIKNEQVALIYLKLNKDISVKAGDFPLNRNMDVKAIFARLSDGSNTGKGVKITFKEGVTLEKYVSQIAEALDRDYDELMSEIDSEEFVKPLIEEYWFLTDDILNKDIYHPLEGYLYPNTYEFYKDAKLVDIVKKMLNETYKQLDSLKQSIKDSKYSAHEVITMASIIEKEAVTDEDRKMVSQVIYKRLKTGMNLGMDVTTYYAAKKDMKETLTQEDLNSTSPYNTRLLSKKGLPVGPICNPSKSSMKAAMNPADTDYTYFFADVATKKVYFTSSYNEFLTFKEMYG